MRFSPFFDLTLRRLVRSNRVLG